MNGRERVLAMLEDGTPDSLPLMPITMMYAADHGGVKYGQYATDHRVLAEGQIAIAETFDFDYVSCISDPAREATDCGAAVEFFDDQPPAIMETKALLADKSQLTNLEIPDPTTARRMSDRVAAAALLKRRAGDSRLVEGWIEGPCAEAADLRGINTLMVDFYDDPGFVRDLFEFTLQMGVRFARAQTEAGVDLMGVGDAAASLVGPELYNELVWPYEKRLVDELHAMGTRVRLHICGNIRSILVPIGQLGCDIVDLDFMVPVEQARQAMGENQILLGNIDPVRVLKQGTPERVTEALAQCHREAGPRYIVGAGCEIPRRTPVENVRALTRYARGTRA
ncbi:MAG: uroporphyrinogen decarboxylase family protein [Planctomycetota bacterium]